VSFFFSLVPMLGFLIFCTKVIGLMPTETFQQWIYATDWQHLTTNQQSWLAAGRECFFTWIFLGSAIVQLASHNHFRHNLARDITLVSLITVAALALAGLLGISIVSVVKSAGYQFKTSSFESRATYTFMRRVTSRHGRTMPSEGFVSATKSPTQQFFYPILLSSAKGDSGFTLPTPMAGKLRRPPSSDTVHMSLLAGVKVVRDGQKLSGYQVMRLATELVPAYAAILGPQLLSPFWVVTFYFSLIVFSLGQQLAVVHTLVSSLIAVKAESFLDFESALTFLSCLMGLVLCFPMATEVAVFIVHFLDYVVGCSWWTIVLYLTMLYALFGVPGSVYQGAHFASVLIPGEREGGKRGCLSSIALAILSFNWNVVRPFHY